MEKTKNAYKTQEGKIEILKSYEAFLNQWALPHEEIYVDTRYGKTYITVSGEKSAPPLILLHGTGTNSLMWMGDAGEYSKKYRVYAVDIPGEPGRSVENQLPLAGSFYADWLKDVLDALGIKKTSIIGISLGAWLAVKFTVIYNERVDRLVLLAPSGIGPQKKSFLLIFMYYALLGKKGVKKLYNKINGNKLLPEVMLQYQILISKNFNYRQETVPLFSDEELRKLTMPTALFVGEKDIMLHSLKTAERLGNLLPHAVINVQREAGHSIVNLTDKINGFLD